MCLDPQVVCMIPWHLKNLMHTKSLISYSQMASGYGQIQHMGCLCHVLFLISYHSPWHPLTTSSTITSQWYDHVIIDIHKFSIPVCNHYVPIKSQHPLEY